MSFSLSISLPQPKEAVFKPHPQGSNLKWLKPQSASVSQTIFLFGETLKTFTSAGLRRCLVDKTRKDTVVIDILAVVSSSGDDGGVLLVKIYKHVSPEIQNNTPLKK